MTAESTLIRVERVCADLTTSGQPITFTTVAQQAQTSRATLYRDPQLRAIVDEHRTRQTDARTLTGLATEVAHLRTAVEALAEGVKRHEEQLRKITKPGCVHQGGVRVGPDQRYRRVVAE